MVLHSINDQFWKGSVRMKGYFHPQAYSPTMVTLTSTNLTGREQRTMECKQLQKGYHRLVDQMGNFHLWFGIQKGNYSSKFRHTGQEYGADV
ncbi:hypothetical protein M378DRAFT_168914 [Amanita muscaria Koide BX008]|uniref:Uncharacterized protein n=1 Tax=Amanita muscaria (strain Koide BX008) TaxID=946122 RepID=A0A0C2SAD3_AMAMK|nr:hypothetical protein M378DRAFT_168914 [Amanita muscaria Koide BX008]